MMNILIAEVEGWFPKHIDPSDEPEQLQEVFAKKRHQLLLAYAEKH